MSSTPQLEALLTSVFLEEHGKDEPQFEGHRGEFVFQMTDCLGDLERLVALLHDPLGPFAADESA